MPLKTHIDYPGPPQALNQIQPANFLRIWVPRGSLGSWKSPSHHVLWQPASPDHQTASLHQRAPSRVHSAPCRPDPCLEPQLLTCVPSILSQGPGLLARSQHTDSRSGLAYALLSHTLSAPHPQEVPVPPSSSAMGPTHHPSSCPKLNQCHS